MNSSLKPFRCESCYFFFEDQPVGIVYMWIKYIVHSTILTLTSLFRNLTGWQKQLSIDRKPHPMQTFAMTLYHSCLERSTLQYGGQIQVCDLPSSGESNTWWSLLVLLVRQFKTSHSIDTHTMIKLWGSLPSLSLYLPTWGIISRLILISLSPVYSFCS